MLEYSNNTVFSKWEHSLYTYLIYFIDYPI